ncbi:hypothetical protein NARC_10364 [Candidatus Nitrosocosmicus arcticus]|uniref:Uncharacterized protein n=1 Tax=Candidatus Nitrosocosmicus arcticus TaxID=2035267 RepID=A0A557SZC1_9ARCH|nr:hypothetical protein NARC_10364 [Candidatus Nitrosocosmicus arcticus]
MIKEFYGSFTNKNQAPRNFCQNEVEWITMDGMPTEEDTLNLNLFLRATFQRC